MSDLPSATQPDLSAALAALTAELDDRPIDGGDYDHITPILSHLTIGHLRQIAAALAGPYVPGMAEVATEDEAGIDWHAVDSACVVKYAAGTTAAVDRTYFVAVQS